MKTPALNVRTRLTLWYLAAVSGVLLVYCGGVYSMVRNSLFDTIDRQLRQDIETAEDDLESVLSSGTDESQSGADRDRWLLEIWGDDGLRKRAWPSRTPPPLGALPVGCREKRTTFTSVTSADGLELRVACREVARSGTVIRSARSAERISAQLRQLGLPMALGLPVAALFASVGGFFLGWRALRPIQKMTELARAISANHLDRRLPVQNPHDELGQLAATFNQTFASLEASFEQMRRFTADASHELRSPLAAMRTTGEVALKTAKGEHEHREALSSILEEIDSLRELADDLLTLSRADAGQVKPDLKRIDLAVLAREVTQQLEVLAEDKGQVLAFDLATDALVEADARILRRAISNLVDNAIKYSPNDSQIVLTVNRQAGIIALSVIDQGPGIHPAFHERIFDRFFRVDESRSRQNQGAGLGLAIARWSVEVNGGRLRVVSDGTRGAAFVIELPVARPRSS